MKKVLIALDFDPTAQKVAEAGYFLAKAMNAEVTLIHVVADVTYYSAYSVLDTYPSTGIMGIQGMEAAHLFDNSLKDAMGRFLEKSKIHLGDKEIKTVVKEGDFGKAILKEAQEMKANVIVMGSHSRRWLENIIMGSVAEDVLRHTTVPLFIVPTKKK